MLDRIALDMRNLAARKGLGFEVVRSRCWVVSDPMLLYRIVLNLAQNAHPGQICRCLTLRRRRAGLGTMICNRA